MSIASCEKVPADLTTNVCFNSCQVNLDLLPTPMTSAHRDANITAATGMVIYNSDDGGLQVYNGTVWETVAAGGTGVAPYYDRRVLQTTVSGVWNAGAVNVELDAQRSGDVCVLTVTAATGFNGNHIISGGTGNGSSAVAIVDITALPATIYGALHNNPTTVMIQVVSGGSVTPQPGTAQFSTANNTDLDITWPGDVTGAAAGFYQFSYTYMGVPNPH